MKILFLILLVSACLPSKPAQVANKKQWVEQMGKTIALKYQQLSFVTPEQALEKKQTLQWIDARSLEERNISTLPGALSADDSLVDREQTHFVFYCTIGERSALAAQKFIERGFRNVSVLRGGILAWAHEGGDFTDPLGSTTKQVHVFSKAWDFLPEDYHAIIP